MLHSGIEILHSGNEILIDSCQNVLSRLFFIVLVGGQVFVPIVTSGMLNSGNEILIDSYENVLSRLVLIVLEGGQVFVLMLDAQECWKEAKNSIP